MESYVPSPALLDPNNKMTKEATAQPMLPIKEDMNSLYGRTHWHAHELMRSRVWACGHLSPLWGREAAEEQQPPESARRPSVAQNPAALDFWWEVVQYRLLLTQVDNVSLQIPIFCWPVENWCWRKVYQTFPAAPCRLLVSTHHQVNVLEDNCLRLIK